MLKRIRHIVLACILLAGAHLAPGQSVLPDTACQFALKHYWVDTTTTTGSTYTWQIDGVVQQTGTMAMFAHTWNTLGDFVVSVQETSAAGCEGPIRLLPVHVKNEPPEFTLPVLATGYCVEDITAAIFNPFGTYYVDDLIPPRPDFFLLPFGDPLLDITNIIDDCPGDLVITWVIDFPDPAPPDDLAGNDQISVGMPPEGIKFPVGITRITWTVKDSGGNSTTHSKELEVFPRPEIGDITF
jgi:hypothetical protein